MYWEKHSVLLSKIINADNNAGPLRCLKFAQTSAPHRFTEERISLNLLNIDTLQPFTGQAKNAHPHILNILVKKISFPSYNQLTSSGEKS